MIEIVLNGEARRVAPGLTVEALVAELGLAGQAVALAINRSVVPRARWHEASLAARDRVDIVRAIGGG